MSEMVKARRNSNFTGEEIERALHALATLQGNTRRTMKLLAAEGLTVSDGTLRRWAYEHFPDRYQQIAREEMPRIYGRIATKNEEVVDKVLDIEDKVLRRLDANVDELEVRDLGKTLQNLGVSKGIAQDKASLIRGMPTEIRETRDLGALLAQLQRKFPGVVNPELIEGEAREIAGDS